MSTTHRRGLWVFKETEKYTSVYETLEKIGGGAYGRVYKCRRKSGPSEIRAVKVIDKSHFRDELGLFRHEISIMTKLDHQNVIKFHEFFEDAQRLYIVMELCQGGELFTYMRRKFQRRGCVHDHCKCLVPCCCLVKPKAYSEKQVAVWLRQVAEGLKYLHSLRIVHADLKPHNIMFVNDDPESELKIIDFGLASVVKKKHLIRGQDGTPEYMAPEVVQGRYTFHSDMWSFGCLMFTMLFGYSPFWTHSVYETYHLIVDHGFRPDSPTPNYDNSFPSYPKVSDSAKDLIVKLLQRDPVRRLTAAEALEHPWLTGMEATNVEIPRVASSLVQMHDRTLLQRHVLNMIIDSLTDKDLEDWKKSIPHIAKVGDKISFKNLRSLLQHAKTLEISGVKTPVTVHRSLKQTPEEFTLNTAQGVAEILDQTVDDVEMQAQLLQSTNPRTGSSTPETAVLPDQSSSNENVTSPSSDVGQSGVMALRAQLDQIQHEAEAKERALRMDADEYSDEHEASSCWCFGKKKRRSRRQPHTSVSNAPETEAASGGARKLRDVDWAAFNLREMLISSIEYRLMMKEERIWGAFDKIDADHDGQIGVKELARVFKISVEEAQKIVDAADQNGDGAINLDEFISEFSKREAHLHESESKDLTTSNSAPIQTGTTSSISSGHDVLSVMTGASFLPASTTHANSERSSVNTSSSEANVYAVSLTTDSETPSHTGILEHLPAPTVHIEVRPDANGVLNETEAKSEPRDDKLTALRPKSQPELRLDIGLGLDVNAPKLSNLNVRAVGFGHYDPEATPISAEKNRLQFANATGVVPNLMARVVAPKTADGSNAPPTQAPTPSTHLSRISGAGQVAASPSSTVSTVNVTAATVPSSAVRTTVGLAEVQLDDRAYIVGCPISSVLISSNGSPQGGNRRLQPNRCLDETESDPIPHATGDIDQARLFGYISSKPQ